MSVIFFATLSAQARLSMYGIASMDSMNSVDNDEEAFVIDAEKWKLSSKLNSLDKC